MKNRATAPNKAAIDSDSTEKAVLGAILVYPDVADTLLDPTITLNFKHEPHKLIYDAARAVWNRGEPVDAIRVRDELTQRRADDLVGGMKYIADLTFNAPDAAIAMSYAEKLVQSTTNDGDSKVVMLPPRDSSTDVEASKKRRNKDVLDAALARVKHFNTESFEAYLLEQLECCESPAEKLFFLGLVLDGLHTQFNIMPQYVVKTERRQYRVDFALTYPFLPDPIVPDVYAVGGYELLDALYPTINIAAEVDGHDFHERTKSQATRDRRRDRDLTAAGWIVLRFTGSEIYSDWKRYLSEDSAELGFVADLVNVAHERWLEMVKHRAR